MKKNKKALSLIIAIGITLVMALLAIFILDYMIPFWKNTKNIEQSVSAYYQADSAIEQALYSMSWTSLWAEIDKDILSTSPRDYWIDMISSWTVLPPVWQWNSEFNSDYNRISIWDPIQIEIWNNSIDPANFKLYFRVPDLDWNWNNDETLSWGILKIINWQLSSSNDVLNASGSQITATQINWVLKSWDEIFKSLWVNQDWLTLNDSSNTFAAFYTSNCWTNSGCILKMSVINKLETSSESVPYLEWKIYAWSSIPLRYRIIETTWKSYWFQKELRVKVPQQTLNEAFDFTVFQ